MIKITTHEERPSGIGPPYRCWRFEGTINGERFMVDCEDGQYSYIGYLPSIEDDEPLQIAIGEYMAKHGIGPGMIHR